jgi:hypothetical protein
MEQGSVQRYPTDNFYIQGILRTNISELRQTKCNKCNTKPIESYIEFIDQGTAADQFKCDFDRCNGVGSTNHIHLFCMDCAVSIIRDIYKNKYGGYTKLGIFPTS